MNANRFVFRFAFICVYSRPKKLMARYTRARPDLHNPLTVLEGNFRTQRLRELPYPLDDCRGQLRAWRHWPPALGAALAETERDRMQIAPIEFALAIEHGLRHHALPIFLVRGESARVVGRTRVEHIGRTSSQRKPVLVVVLLRLETHCLAFEDEIRQAVKDRLTFVDLNATQDVRSVSGKQIGAGVYDGMREGYQESGRRFPVARRALVRMDRYHHPIGLPPRLADSSRDLLQVLRVGFGHDPRLLAGSKGRAEKTNLVRRLRSARFTLGAQLRQRAQRSECRRLHRVSGLEAQRIQARPSL